MTTDNLGLDLSLINYGEDDSILAGIWRQIINDLGLDQTTILDAVDRYAKAVTKDKPNKTSQIRGNLRTDVGKTGMTLFTFKKCLRVIKVNKVEMDFKLHHSTRESNHKLVIELDDSFFDEKSEKEEKADKTPNELSIFFNEICYKLGIGIREFEALLESYMRREKLVINLRNKTSVRGYLKKDFTSPKMSWKTFMKAMVFLCVVKMEINIKLYYRKHESDHVYNVLLGDLEDYVGLAKNEIPF